MRTWRPRREECVWRQENDRYCTYLILPRLYWLIPDDDEVAHLSIHPRRYDTVATGVREATEQGFENTEKGISQNVGLHTLLRRNGKKGRRKPR